MTPTNSKQRESVSKRLSRPSLGQEPDELAEEADCEAKGRLSLLSQSNALWKSVKEKKDLLVSLAGEIESKYAEYKSLC